MASFLFEQSQCRRGPLKPEGRRQGKGERHGAWTVSRRLSSYQLRWRSDRAVGFLGESGRAAGMVQAASGSFDCGAGDKADAPASAQDDGAKQAKARATSTATARANTEILAAPK